jgi:hypothetical protein
MQIAVSNEWQKLVNKQEDEKIINKVGNYEFCKGR